jgi:uncharacterized protein (TIGR02246 family)
MRNLKTLCLTFAFLASSAIAGPKEDAVQVVERWSKAFTEADVDTIVSLYAPDAAFIGTGSKTILTQPEDIRKYFQGALLGTRRFVATIVANSVTPASETAYVITAMDKLVVTVDGKSQDVFGRVTFVVAKRDSGWKIVSFHRSTMPA